MLHIPGTAAACAVLLAAQPAAAATIDFEGFAPGTTIAAGTGLSGLFFDQAIVVDRFGFLDGPATDGMIGFNPSPRGGTVTGFFAGTVSALTVGAGDACCDFDEVTLSGYSADWVLIDSVTIRERDSRFLTVSGPGIARFSIAQGSGGFDNISFDLIPAVPLPAGLPLFLTGLGAVALLRRKRTL